VGLHVASASWRVKEDGGNHNKNWILGKELVGWQDLGGVGGAGRSRSRGNLSQQGAGKCGSGAKSRLFPPPPSLCTGARMGVPTSTGRSGVLQKVQALFLSYNCSGQALEIRLQVNQLTGTIPPSLGFLQIQVCFNPSPLPQGVSNPPQRFTV